MDIRTVDVVFLHGPHRPERRVHIEKMLSDKNISGKCIEGVCDQGKKSGSVSFIRLLKDRLVEPFVPFVCLEDDCSATPWFNHFFPVPEDADAVYLGLSSYGIHPRVDQAVLYVQCDHVSDELVRVFNMLSTHAIFFKTRRWVENCIECFERAATSSRPESWDLPLARSMKNFNVYALKRPMFYQDASVGGQQEPTLITVN